mmetsp:Transcript_144839/g.252557  ORF Transcript_144839/g.252557 Transcript_144839/m.252557 type:complete len:313 (-) Transcript_144839:3077-4015(-)
MENPPMAPASAWSAWSGSTFGRMQRSSTKQKRKTAVCPQKEVRSMNAKRMAKRSATSARASGEGVTREFTRLRNATVWVTRDSLSRSMACRCCRSVCRCRCRRSASAHAVPQSAGSQAVSSPSAREGGVPRAAAATLHAAAQATAVGMASAAAGAGSTEGGGPSRADVPCMRCRSCRAVRAHSISCLSTSRICRRRATWRASSRCSNLRHVQSSVRTMSTTRLRNAWIPSSVSGDPSARIAQIDPRWWACSPTSHSSSPPGLRDSARGVADASKEAMQSSDWPYCAIASAPSNAARTTRSWNTRQAFVPTCL